MLTAATFAQARPYSFQWDPNYDGVTTGYLVSYGTAPGSYGSTGDIDNGNSTSFQVDLLAGRTYYFIVKAYSASHVPGPASTELSFFVPPDPTINVSSTSAAGGANVTATIGNGPGNRFDWIGLYAVGSSTQLAFKYLNGSQTAPATGSTTASVPFTMPTVSGQYQLRFYSNNSYSLLATSATVTVTGTATPPPPPPPPAVSITPASTSVLSGGNLAGTIANGPANPLDWVGLYLVGSNTLLDWKYLSGGTRVAPASGVTGGTVNFTAPAPGLYNLRFFPNNSMTVLATSATVTVTSSGASATASVTLSSATVTPGAGLTVTMANGPGNRLDWVALYAVGGNTFLDWKYLSGTSAAPASGLTGAALTFTAPMAPGAYQVRFFSNNSYTVLASSATLTVAASASGPSITPSSTTIAPGAMVTVTLANGPGNRLDWVGLYANGAPTFLDWKYMSDTATAPASGLTGAVLTFKAPKTPGTYQLRYFSNNSYTLLASSPMVTVQ